MAWQLSFYRNHANGGESWGAGNFSSSAECLVTAAALYRFNGAGWNDVRGECVNQKLKKPLPAEIVAGRGGAINPDEYYEIIRFDHTNIQQLSGE